MKALFKKPLFYVICLLLIVGVVGKYQKPKLKAFIDQQFQSVFIEESFPLAITYETFNISLFPLGIRFSNIKILPKPKGPIKIQGEIEIEKLLATPSVFEILFGKPFLDSLEVENCRYKIQIPKNNTDKKKKGFILSEILNQTPIGEIRLKNCSGTIDTGDGLQVTHTETNLTAFNQKTSLLAHIKSPKIIFKNSGNKSSKTFSLTTQFSANDKSVSLANFQMTQGKNYFLASGNLRLRNRFTEIVESRISTRIRIDIQELADSILPWKDQLPGLEKAQGVLSGDSIIYKTANSFFKAEIKILGENLEFGGTKVGNITIEGKSLDERTISFSKISLKLPGESNSVEINKLKVFHEKLKNIQFATELRFINLNLNSFLREANISKASVWLNAKGVLNCEGSLKKTFYMSCPGSLTIRDFLVQSPSKARIIGFKSMTAKGTGEFTEKNFKFDVQLATQKSSGKARGVVDFEKGFRSEFSAEKFEFKEFGRIGNLDIEGIAKLDGFTTGDGRVAIFDIGLESSNTFLSQYQLGDLKTKLEYRKGTIFLKDMNGAIKSTRYSGELLANLIDEKLKGKITFPFLRMLDVQDAVSRKVDLQKRMTGSGSGFLSLNTSFDIDRLNFDFKANLFDGLAFGESYDKVDVFLRGTEGVIDLKNFAFKKKSSKALVTGFLDMNLDTSLKIDFIDGNLKESTNLKSIKLPAEGNVAGTGWVSGNLDSPTIKIKAFSENFKFNDFAYGSSEILYESVGDKSSLEYQNKNSGKLKVVQSESNEDTLEVEFKGSKFNLAPVLSYLSGQDGNKDYLFNVTGNAQGTFRTDNWWNSNFDFNIAKTEISFKGHRLESEKNFQGLLKDQVLKIDDIVFSGNRQSVRLKSKANKKFSSRLFLDGELNISFLKLFAPFFERIEGQSTIHMELSLMKNDFKLMGSSYTRDGYLQFPGFPHPIENFSADILYNQNSIVINSMKGRLGGGRVWGQGQIKLHDKKDIEIDLKADLEKVSIKFPEGIQSKGSGAMQLKGAKFPYKLAGNYTIESGLVDMEIEDEEDLKGSNNQLLAELLNKDVSSPISLDISVDVKKGIDISNSMAEGELQGFLKIAGDLDAPILKGPISFKKNSILLFKDTEFFITDSNFAFQGKSPMNPTLFLTAETRLQNYDIQLLLQGDGQNPKFQLTSQPSLTNRQLVSLLTLGKVSRDLEGEQSSFTIGDNDQNPQGVQIGTNLFKDSAIGKELKRFKGWDIQFSTSLEEGTNYAVPQILVTKKFSKKAKAQLNRQDGRQSQTELRLQYELKDNLSGIFRLKRLENTDNTDQNLALPQADTQFGLDLEYKREFD